MKPTRVAISTALLAAFMASCSSPEYARRTTPVTPVPAVRDNPSVTPVGIGQDDSTTDTWLQQQIDSAPRVEPPVRPELPPLRDAGGETDAYWHERTHYDDYPYRPVSRYYDPRWGHYRGGYYGRSTFPVNTALGAGIGAIIGHQRGRRGRGALIGGGLGLLFDLAR